MELPLGEITGVRGYNSVQSGGAVTPMNAIGQGSAEAKANPSAAQ